MSPTLMPKRVKHRKEQRGRMKGMSKGDLKLSFGEYGLQAIEPGWITGNQIESARIALTRNLKKGGKVWINVFPHKPYTKQPAETRMGGGKGEPEQWIAVVKPGKIIFEISGVDTEVAREAIRRASHKLSIKTKYISEE